MNLGVISTVRGYKWAGSEELWHGMALDALDSGHKVTAYIHQDLQEADQTKVLRENGGVVRVRETLRFSRLWALKEKISPSFPLPELRSFDIILVSLGSLLDLFYVPGLREALRHAGVPYVLLCQFNAEGLPFSPAQRLELEELMRTSTGSCFVSQHNLDLAERQLTLKLPAARVIGNPIRKVMAQALPWPEGEITRLGCVARFDVLWKGQDLLLEILSRPPWNARNWTLSLFGEGPDRDHLKKAVSFFGLEDRVEFRGYVRDLETIWQTQHLMVLPSRGEGMPLAILEAMMCGRPVVTTDVGGNRELVTDGVTGFIAAAATVTSFGDALERAWGDRSGWEKMGIAAHERAKEMASSDPCRQLLDYLKGLVPPGKK